MRFSNIFFTSLSIAIILIGNILTAQTPTPPSSGDGSRDNPYQITNLDNLYWLSQSDSVRDKYFIQTADINAAETSTWDADSGFLPIGNSTIAFSGEYDGRGCAIDSLYINRSTIDRIGFFGYTNDAVIKNLGITNANISGDDRVAAIVGSNDYSKISNCYASGKINGDYNVGGIVGRNGSSDGASSMVNNCYSEAIINGTHNIGGLVGYNYSSTINNCYSTGSVNGTVEDIGGLVGDNDNYAAINYCFSTDSVSGGANTGGLVGSNRNGATVSNSFWNTETSGQNYSAGGTAKSDSLMKDYNTFTDETSEGLDSAWDFILNLNDDSGGSSYWDMDQEESVNGGYPILTWQKGADQMIPIVPLGSGTAGDPYQISSLYNLNWLMLNSGQWDKVYMQTADINAAATEDWFNGSGFKAIGNHDLNFSGDYHGKGHIIDSLYINRNDMKYNGLFGIIWKSLIDSLGVTNVNIKSNNYAGALAGYDPQTSSINGCYSSGNISGYSYVGGLIGRTFQTSIENCYSLCSVSGFHYVGGFAGYCRSSRLNNIYSTGKVSGNSDIGGLIGYNSSSYINNSFWDREASKQSASAGGNSRTTAEMKELNIDDNSFYTSGWDYVDSTLNGTDDIWNQGNGRNNDHPYLSWQFPQDNLGLTGTSEIPLAQKPQGDGSENNPYQIASTENLLWLSQTDSVWDKNFIQTEDIDIDYNNMKKWNGKRGFSPIGQARYFTGLYDGKNHTIDSLFINRDTEKYIGLFGYVSGGKIINLRLTNADINGYTDVGVLVGIISNAARISNCYSTGKIEGFKITGGLVGYNNNSEIDSSLSSCRVYSDDNYAGGLLGYNYKGVIEGSSSDGEVHGDNYAGGLIGYNTTNYDTIKNCFSRADVYGINYIGGLIGYNVSSNIEYCYSAGKVFGQTNTGGLIGYTNSDINNSFWDMEISGQTTSAGGTGKTTAEMKDVATFTDENREGLSSAWDFKYNPNDDQGTDDYWAINDSYPILAWQDTTEDIPTDLEKAALVPDKFSLSQNYPNPFNPTTTIEFTISKISNVKLTIYNILGKKIRTFELRKKNPGRYSITWKGKNDFGTEVTTGVYFYKIIAGDNMAIRKMIFVK